MKLLVRQKEDKLWKTKDLHASSSIPLEFGARTSTVEIGSFDGVPFVKATENKEIEEAPTAHCSFSIPPGSVVRVQMRLEVARGAVNLGIVRGDGELGRPFRKPEMKDLVWYYCNEGALRNGARSIGKQAPPAGQGDTISMTISETILSLHLNGVPLQQVIPDVVGPNLYFAVQLSRKGDCVSLVKQEFDEDTLFAMLKSTWSSFSLVGSGKFAQHPFVQLLDHRRVAKCVHAAPDYFGQVVPEVQCAAVIEVKRAASWKVQLLQLSGMIYIGLEDVDWPLGKEWWSSEGMDRVWYYGSDGSVRNGNQVLVKHEERGRERVVPALKEGDVLQVLLEEGRIVFKHNGNQVDFVVSGVSMSVRLAVQFEEKNDSIALVE